MHTRLYRYNPRQSLLFDGGIGVVTPFGPGARVAFDILIAEAFERDIAVCRAVMGLTVANDLFVFSDTGRLIHSAWNVSVANSYQQRIGL